MANQVALHDLAVVKVELQLKIRCTEFFQYRHGLRLAREKKAGHIARINRLDEYLSTYLGRFTRSKAQIADIGGVVFSLGRGIGIFREQPRHGMNPRAVERLGVT